MNDWPPKGINMDARAFFNHPDAEHIFGDHLNVHDWTLIHATLGEAVPRDSLVEAALHSGSHNLLDEYLLGDTAEEDGWDAHAHYCVRSQSHYDWFAVMCCDENIRAALRVDCDIILHIADDVLETVLTDHGQAILDAMQSLDTPWSKIPRERAARLVDYAIATARNLGGFIPWADLREAHFNVVVAIWTTSIITYLGRVDYASIMPHLMRRRSLINPPTVVKIYDIAGRDETIQYLVQEYIRVGKSHYIVNCIVSSPDPLDILERVRRLYPEIAKEYLWDIAARWPISNSSYGGISEVFAGYCSIPEPTNTLQWNSVITAVHTRELAHTLFPAELHKRATAMLPQKPSLLVWMVEKGYTWDGQSRELAEYESLPAVKTLAKYYYVGELEPKARTLAAKWSSQHHSVVGYLELGFKLTRRWAATIVAFGQRKEVAHLLGLLADEHLNAKLFP